MRIGSISIFHLSKLWKAMFFILCGVLVLVRLQGKFEVDNSWERKGWGTQRGRVGALAFRRRSGVWLWRFAWPTRSVVVPISDPLPRGGNPVHGAVRGCHQERQPAGVPDRDGVAARLLHRRGHRWRRPRGRRVARAGAEAQGAHPGHHPRDRRGAEAHQSRRQVRRRLDVAETAAVLPGERCVWWAREGEGREEGREGRRKERRGGEEGKEGRGRKEGREGRKEKGKTRGSEGGSREGGREGERGGREGRRNERWRRCEGGGGKEGGWMDDN